MATLKDYNLKIRSFRNTQKITQTMKMVSASKLRKVQVAQVHGKVYAQQISALTARITNSIEMSSHPLLEIRPEVKNILILVITADRGLCGVFNHNTIRYVGGWVSEHQKSYHRVDFSFCGKKGYLYFRRRRPVKSYYEHVTSRPQFEDAIRISQDVMDSFIRREYDEVYLAYSQFFSPISQKTILEKILPIDARSLFPEAAPKRTEYLFEPPLSELLAFLIPHFVYFKIYFALLENAAGEHGARMTAMDNATKNASDLIEGYTLLRNRARQAEITTELAEIITGAETLK